jgi:hypothetical protein
MAIRFEDGTLLIHATLDGPFEPIVKVKEVETTPTLL